LFLFLDGRVGKSNRSIIVLEGGMSGTAMPITFWQKTFFDKWWIIPSSVLNKPSHSRHCLVW
jgi:hypothetical protein